MASPPPRRAFHSLRAWCVLFIILISGLTADLLTKRLAFDHVAAAPVRPTREELLSNPDWMPPPHAPVTLLPGQLLDLQLVVNRGAVFGIGENQRGFFIVFTLAALGVGLFMFGRMTTEKQWLAHIAVGLILAGGIGNLYDRITLGVVRDFLHMLPGRHLPMGWRWPRGSPELFPWVFNVADMMLLLGMAMLMIHMSRAERQRKAALAAAESPSAAAESPSAAATQRSNAHQASSSSNVDSPTNATDAHNHEAAA